MRHPLRLGFLASRNGSSFRRIVTALRHGELDAQACLLVSNNRSAPALAFAAENSIPALVIPTQGDPEGADQRLCEAMKAADVDLIILSGYLRRLGPLTLSQFRNRVLNIHPGPLPRFGGEGMYGRKVHEAVIAAGEEASGCAIHLVDEEYDHGPVLAQLTCPLDPGETAETLEAKITALEPDFYLATLKRVLAGELCLP